MRIFHGQFLPSPPPQVGVLIKNITYPICMEKRTHFCASIIVTVRKASRSEIILQNSLSQMTSEHFEWLLEKYTTVEVLSGII